MKALTAEEIYSVEKSTIMKKSVALALVLTVVAGLGADPAQAVQNQLGKYGVWFAYMQGKGKAKTCFLHGSPGKMRGKYAKRGEVFIQITHRPPKAQNEVSITAGYPFEKDSDVDIDIDGKAFELFTDKDSAWSRDAKGDLALVRAMRSGTVMVVKGTSSRGTKTTDTYFLKGFTAAHNLITKACGVRKISSPK